MRKAPEMEGSNFIVKMYISLCLFLFVEPVVGQLERYQGNLVIYPTYAHYEGDSGITHLDTFIQRNLFVRFFGNAHYYFRTQKKIKKERKKIHIATRKIWGFRWGKNLYRVSPRNRLLYVAHISSVVYYELLDDDNDGDLITQFWSPESINESVDVGYISKHLGTELILVKRRGIIRNRFQKQVEALIDFHPNKQQFLDCLSYSQTMAGIRACFDLLDKKEDK